MAEYVETPIEPVRPARRSDDGASEGSDTGLMIGVIAGGLVLFLLCGGGLALFGFAFWRHSEPPAAVVFDEGPGLAVPGPVDKGAARIDVEKPAPIEPVVPKDPGPKDIAGKGLVPMPPAEPPFAAEERQAVELIQKRGWSLARHDNGPGKPVTGVYLGGKGQRSISAADLKVLAGLKQVRHFYLNQMQVTDAGLQELAGLKQLQALDIFGTQVTDAGLKGLAGLTKLEILNLGATKVTDAGLKNLAGLTQLKTLILGYGTPVTDAGLKELAGLSKLQTLTLRFTKVSGTGLKYLAGLQRLAILDLYGTQMTDAGVKELARHKQLRKLDLRATKVTDAGLKELTGLEELRELFLHAAQVTPAGVAELQKALPKCTIAR